MDSLKRNQFDNFRISTELWKFGSKSVHQPIRKLTNQGTTFKYGSSDSKPGMHGFCLTIGDFFTSAGSLSWVAVIVARVELCCGLLRFLLNAFFTGSLYFLKIVMNIMALLSGEIRFPGWIVRENYQPKLAYRRIFHDVTSPRQCKIGV